VIRRARKRAQRVRLARTALETWGKPFAESKFFLWRASLRAFGKLLHRFLRWKGYSPNPFPKTFDRFAVKGESHRKKRPLSADQAFSGLSFL